MALAHAATTPSVEAPPFTAKEIAQGFREHIILAKPRAQHRTTVDADEAREGVRTRTRFSRFGDLRIIELDDADSATAAIARLQATGRYEFVEPDHIYRADVVPNDAAVTTQWSLNNTGQSGGVAGADIKAFAAWDIIHDAPNVVVAVLDTGINATHQDIAANMWVNPAPTFGDVNGARFQNSGSTRNGITDGRVTDDEASGHGTHVAGTIGALGNNGLNVSGVAWKVQLMAVKVLTASGSGSTTDIVNGINYAVAHGAQIINASLGEATGAPFDQSFYNAIAGARAAGVIFVAAAGNDGADADLATHYPASYALDNIVSVGCSQRNDFVSSFSNYGAAVDLFAPGESILSLTNANNTGTRTLSGTSMAAPHVAGALALLKSRFPTDTYRQLINRLLRGVDPGSRFTGKVQTSGRLNLLNALNTASDAKGSKPFNDDFARRAKLIGDNFLVRSNNADASTESGEPAHAGATGGNSLWWEWTPASTASVRATTTGSGYDTTLAIYTGSALGALTLVAANDDDANSGATTSRIEFTAQAGVTYQFAVDGKNGATGLTLLNIGSVPANDAFASPVALKAPSDSVAATNANCTRETGEPRIAGFTGGTSLWYQWTAPKSGRCQVAVTSADFDPLLAIYTGSAVNALTLVTSNDNATPAVANNSSLCTFNATAGTTYHISVDAKSGTGSFVLTLNDSLWQAVATGAITGAPAVASDGTVYAGSTDNSLYAFAADGTPKWSFPTGSLIDTCSPAIGADGTVFVGSGDGKLYALNPDGTLKWSHDFNTAALPVGAGNSPAVAGDGTVYIKISDGFLHAINPTDGSERWKANVNAPLASFYGSPIVAPDGTIYQGSDENDAALYALNPDGTQKWRFKADSGIYATPALDAIGNVYFCTLTGGVYSVTSTGNQRWRASSGGNISSSPAISADGTTLYYGGYDQKFYARSTATGTATWTLTLANEVRASSPAIDANGVIYVGCYDGNLYAITPSGAVQRTWTTGLFIRSCPAISGTSLYIGSNDEKLYALDLGTSSAAGPWPQYKANPARLGRAVAATTVAIVTAPQAQTTVVGSTVQLSVAATGPAPLTYQWFKDGVALVGQTSATLTLANATAANAGNYSVVVNSPVGSATSAPVAVAVEAPNPGRLTNLSARAVGGLPGTQSFAIGFALAGTADKAILVRGIGPSLAQFGVASVLADPQLQLLAGSTVLASNDDWATPATNFSALTNAFAASGAFALGTSTKDAALVRSLPAGNYTALVAAPSGSGPSLAELYDTAPSSGVRLVNVSARGPVGTGSNLLIAGFAINGNMPKQVLIRAVGPSLTQFGFAGVLTNPRLDLFSGATLIQSNDDWGGASNLAAAFAATGAFAFTSVNSRDSALLVTLAPGNYTAQVSGVNNTTGTALVEVYEVP